MPDYPSIKTAYDRDGFVIVKEFLTTSELSELRGEIERYIREVVPTLPGTHAFYQDKAKPESLKQMQFMEKVDPWFRAFCDHPRWTALGEALLGEAVATRYPMWFNKPPGADHPTPPHQDNHYSFYEPCRFATLWLALDEVDDENGCLRYVPGSHLRGFRPHSLSSVLGFSQGITDYGPADEAAEFKAHLHPGDLAAHHGMTIHRADPNRSVSRNRRAIATAITGVCAKVNEEAAERHRKQVAEQHARLGVRKT